MQEIEFKIENAVAHIYFNRPDKFNAFNRAMAFAMQDALDKCANNDAVRAVYLKGNGRAFCAGQDLAELVGENAIGIDKILSEHFNPIVAKIQALEKPVVAAVNGVAAGAGANIALCADIVVATASASFIQAFSKIGLIPDSGGTYFLPRLVGHQKASALMMTGDKVSATEAEKLGMIYKVLEDDVFNEASLQIAVNLAAMPTKGLALTKRALQSSAINNLTQQLNLEDELQRIAAATADYAEGVQSFLEKRAAVFTGK
jgi:2-(1,2-epoxy-1,2-dihydrophenyl)acetyl-CoA isomerase